MRSRTGVLIAIALTVMMFLVPVCSESSDAALPTGVDIELRDRAIDVEANGTAYVYIGISNNTSDDTIRVAIEGHSGGSGVTVGYGTDYVQIEKDGSEILVVTITADAYSPTHTETITLRISVHSPSDGFSSGEEQFTLNVHSTLSAGESYNKIMGILESPFDDSLVTALISLIIWMVIAVALSYFLIPAVISVFVKEGKENRKETRRQVWKLFFWMIMMFAATSCTRIYGQSEWLTATVASIVDIMYIIIGALIIWRVYRSVIKALFDRMSRNSDVGIDDSLLPLFNMIGKILIAVTAFASILAALGFNLLMIVTGAGIVGLAISLGAQSTLSQFFSGLNLLMTRPFRSGDKVILNNDGKVLSVVRVGLMNTMFDDDGNTGTFTMPNDTVAAATINNITGTARTYRITLNVGVGYDSDIELVKRLLLEACMENPRVIKDGSVDMPSIRLDSFDASSINMRISFYGDEFDDRGSIGGMLRESIFRKFNEHGISIPFPQMDIHIENSDKN